MVHEELVDRMHYPRAVIVQHLLRVDDEGLFQIYLGFACNFNHLLVQYNTYQYNSQYKVQPVDTSTNSDQGSSLRR